MMARSARHGVGLRHPERYGSWALVTGASAGLGECFALALAAQGLNVVLVARREDRLAALAERIAREYPLVATRTLALDLGQCSEVDDLLAATGDLEVGLLVCNAGSAMTGSFLARPLDKLMANFDLNARSVVQLCRHFGGNMAARGRGGIIVVSSIVGFTGVPGWSLYAAAKACGRALAMGLADELEPAGIAVQALCPGHIRTEFHEHARIRALWPMSAEHVMQASLAGLGRRRVVVPGWFNKFCVFGLRLLPHALGARLYGWVLRGLQRQERN